MFQAAAEARTVRIRGDQTDVTNGPFAEAARQISGYNIIDCADEQEAIEVAAKHPIARFGSIEVRPFQK